MISELKKEIRAEESAKVLREAMSRGATSDSVKDAFINAVDADTAALGAENDPKIDKVIDIIPEYEEGDDVSETDIEKLTESMEEIDGESVEEGIANRMKMTRHYHADKSLGRILLGEFGDSMAAWNVLVSKGSDGTTLDKKMRSLYKDAKKIAKEARSEDDIKKAIDAIEKFISDIKSNKSKLVDDTTTKSENTKRYRALNVDMMIDSLEDLVKKLNKRLTAVTESLDSVSFDDLNDVDLLPDTEDENEE